MENKDYYATLGVERTATQEEVKQAYRKLARKYHPDVTKEADGEARFKEVAEAYEALGDPEQRAAYDDVGQRYRSGPEFSPPPGWSRGFDTQGGGGHSEFFESMFGRNGKGGRGPRAAAHRPGDDHHGKVQIELRDAYRGGRHTVSLRVPHPDGSGRMAMQERQLDVNIPKGIRQGQRLRLAGQGGPGLGRGSAGDLYLEVEFVAHEHFRVEGRDVHVDLPVAPWEAALGASVTVPTPDGSVEVAVPSGSSAGCKLRLKGQGLPGTPPGDLYAVLAIVLPPAESDLAREAYADLARVFADFDPRGALLSANA